MDSSCSNTDSIFLVSWSGARAWIFGGKGDGGFVSRCGGGPGDGAGKGGVGMFVGSASTAGFALEVLKLIGGAGVDISVYVQQGKCCVRRHCD